MYEKQKHEALERYRKLLYEYIFVLIRASYEQSFSLGKYLITLSAGAIALSIAYIDRMSVAADVISLPLLHFSWYGFIACIILSLLAITISRHGCTKLAENLMKEYISDKVQPEDFGDKGLRNTIAVVNIGVGLCFIIGVVLLMLFAKNNLIVSA